MTAVPRRTEMTIKDLLLEELRKLGVRTESEVSYPSLSGRKQPDALLQNGGEYFLETKLGPETKLIDGMLQGQEYVKLLKGKGSFAVVFPEELRKPMPRNVLDRLIQKARILSIATFSDEDPRTPQKFEGGLRDIAKWMAEHVLRALEIKVEPDADLTIKALRESAEYLRYGLIKIDENEIERIFGGKSVFENILQYSEGNYPIAELRKAASYLLLNQILFYHVLSCARPSRYKKIEEIKLEEPQQVAEYFYRVLEDNYTPIFGFDIVSKLPSHMHSTLVKVIAAIKLLHPERIQVDLLGKIFHDLIPYEDRKYVAAFYTNNEAAELIAGLAVDKPHQKVMDLACGSGALLVASYHRKKDLLELDEGSFGLEDHRRFLEEEITGVDIMPFAAHLAVVHLSLQAPLYETEKVRVAVWDSTQLKPQTKIPTISTELLESEKQLRLDLYEQGKALNLKGKRYVQKGVVTADRIGGEEINLDQVDVVIMNPPFTRQERMPGNYKTRLDRSFNNYSRYLHGRMGLYGYFVFLSDMFTVPGGKVALVLPATVLRVESAIGIRKLLSERFHIEYILTSWEKLAFSEGAWFRDVVIVGRKINPKTKKDEELMCDIVTLKTQPRTRKDALAILTEIKSGKRRRDGIYESETIACRRISQKQLSENINNWFYYVSVREPEIQKIWEGFLEKSKGKVVPFHQILKRRGGSIIRGIETRSKNHVTIQSAFLVKGDHVSQRAGYSWLVKKDSSKKVTARHVKLNEEVKIAKKYVTKGIRSFAGKGKMDVGEECDYVVTGYNDRVFKYLKGNVRKKVAEWNGYVEDRLGEFFVSRRFVLPAPGTVHIAYASEKPVATPATMWVVKKVNAEDAKILSIWFNSSLHLAQLLLNKVEDVWVDIHEYVLENLLVLDLESLSARDKRKFVELFDEVGHSPFPSLAEQIHTRSKLRVKMDKLVLEVLGYEKSEISGILDSLYTNLSSEFEQLSRSM